MGQLGHLDHLGHMGQLGHLGYLAQLGHVGQLGHLGQSGQLLARWFHATTTNCQNTTADWCAHFKLIPASFSRFQRICL